MRKPAFCICENKDADQLAVNTKLISVFVFTIWIVQYLYFLNPKFKASSHLLWLYSPVCVGPGQKPLRQVFSQRGSYLFCIPFQGDIDDIDKTIQTLVKVSTYDTHNITFVISTINGSNHKLHCE